MVGGDGGGELTGDSPRPFCLTAINLPASHLWGDRTHIASCKLAGVRALTLPLGDTGNHNPPLGVKASAREGVLDTQVATPL